MRSISPQIRVAPVVLVILQTTSIRVNPILFRSIKIPMGADPCVDTAGRYVPVESDVSFIGIVREPTKMRTPRIFSFVMLAALVVASGCQLPDFSLFRSQGNCRRGNCRLFKDVGFKHHRLCPFKRFRNPQQPAYEPLVCDSCLQEAPGLLGATCESCAQNGLHDGSFSHSNFDPVPSYSQPSYAQQPVQMSIDPPVESFQAPRELPLQAPAESINIFRNTPAPETVPAPLTAPALLDDSTNFKSWLPSRNSIQPRIPTLRTQPATDVVMQRAERARQRRLAAEAEAKALAEEAKAGIKVATALPPAEPKPAPKVAPKVVGEFLPSVKNLADATESTIQKIAKPSDMAINNDFVAPAKIEEKAPEIVREPTPVKVPELIKPEPVVAAKPQRSEKEVVDELRNSTVPHAVVFDSSPLIPEQRLRPSNPTEPYATDGVVLRARPVQTFQFNNQKPTPQVVESTRIAPPPTLQATTLRPGQYYDRQRVAERTPQPKRKVVDSPVESRNSIPAIQASVKRQVMVAEALQQPQFQIEPLPQQTEVLTSPEGIPLDQISKEPTQFQSLPVMDQLTEPSSIFLENSTTERVRRQIQPEPQPEVQPEPPVRQPAPKTDGILRLRAAPTGGNGTFSNASSAARIKMLQPTYQYDRGQQGQGQDGNFDSEQPPAFRLPKQQGQPMFDYDRIKEEIDRMSKQSRPSNVLDR